MNINSILETVPSYFDVQKNLDINISDIIFYHGTSDIIGLDVGDKLLSSDMTAFLSEVGRKKNLDKVFLTTNYNYAVIYARRTVRVKGGNPVVFTVRPVGVELFKEKDGNNIYTADGAYIIGKTKI